MGSFIPRILRYGRDGLMNGGRDGSGYGRRGSHLSWVGLVCFDLMGCMYVMYLMMVRLFGQSGGLLVCLLVV